MAWFRGINSQIIEQRNTQPKKLSNQPPYVTEDRLRKQPALFLYYFNIKMTWQHSKRNGGNIEQNFDQTIRKYFIPISANATTKYNNMDKQQILPTEDVCPLGIMIYSRPFKLSVDFNTDPTDFIKQWSTTLTNDQIGILFLFTKFLL